MEKDVIISKLAVIKKLRKKVIYYWRKCTQEADPEMELYYRGRMRAFEEAIEIVKKTEE